MFESDRSFNSYIFQHESAHSAGRLSLTIDQMKRSCQSASLQLRTNSVNGRRGRDIIERGNVLITIFIRYCRDNGITVTGSLVSRGTAPLTSSGRSHQSLETGRIQQPSRHRSNRMIRIDRQNSRASIPQNRWLHWMGSNGKA
jgi:hypothetical protein